MLNPANGNSFDWRATSSDRNAMDACIHVLPIEWCAADAAAAAFFFALGFLLLVAVGHACLAKDVLMAYRFAVQHVIILAPFPLFTTGPNFVLHTRAKFYFRDECANPTWHS